VAVFGLPQLTGASAGLSFPGFSFQPSEIAKIALPIFPQSRLFSQTKNEMQSRIEENGFALPRQFFVGFGALILLNRIWERRWFCARSSSPSISQRARNGCTFF
jgi:cell division protein FtsW (lipid II flippase)